MKYISAVMAVLILAFPPTAAGQKVDCRKDLKKARELIDQLWSFKVFKVGAFDLEGSYRQLEPDAKRARTPAACVDVLDRFMAGLQDGHSSLSYYPGLEWTRPRIEIRSLREEFTMVPGEAPPVHAYVVSRDTSKAALRAIAPGSEILSVDGVPIGAMYDSLAFRVSGSTPQWRDYMIDERLLWGPSDRDISLALRPPGGLVQTVTVHRPPYPSQEERERRSELWEDTATIAKARRLEGGWGDLRFTTFAYKDLDTTVARFDEALDSLIDAPGLVIDLRGNGGGYVGAFIAAAGRFVDEKTEIGYIQVREPGQNAVIEFFDPKTGGTTMPPRIAEPRRPIYRGPVVILVDRSCFSACEAFAGGLKAIGRAKIVGERTGGGSGSVGGLRLPSKAIISFSWSVGWLPDGQQIEGHGVAPSVRVHPRPSDWARGEDHMLERAVAVLEKGQAPSLSHAHQN